MKRLWFCLLALLSANSAIHADSGSDIRITFDTIRCYKSSLEAYQREQTTSASVYSKLMRGQISLYQYLVSSQDASDCQFNPSCSHYAQQALANDGLFVGLLEASDRIQRCSALARHSYPRDYRTGRLHDPYRHIAENGLSVNHATTADSCEFGSRPTKSVSLAVTMSMILPGSGRIYSGRSLDGVSSMIGTLVPAAFAYASFDRDGIESIRGWFHALTAAGIYLGNMWGSAEAAQRYNTMNAGLGRLQFAYPSGSDLANSESLITRIINDCDSCRITQSSTETQSKFQIAAFSLAANQFDTATVRFLDLGSDHRVGGLARFFQSISHVENHQWDAALMAMQMADGQYFGPADSKIVRNGLGYLTSMETGDGRSAKAAKWLSAIIPGSGQAYCRRPVKGIASAGLNMLAAYYIYHCIRTESDVEIFVAALPMFLRFYIGGIQSAGKMAELYNLELNQQRTNKFYIAIGTEY
jgi:putative component of membrane protein insertase Oxa1/YidC/SpoIIIJ protein YidD